MLNVLKMVNVVLWIGLHLFNDETCTPGYISRPARVGFSHICHMCCTLVSEAYNQCVAREQICCNWCWILFGISSQTATFLEITTNLQDWIAAVISNKTRERIIWKTNKQNSAQGHVFIALSVLKLGGCKKSPANQMWHTRDPEYATVISAGTKLS